MYIYNEIETANSDRGQRITAIGCGTSTGVGGARMSYNVVAWDPSSRRWGATFYSDRGDGSGFTRDLITLRQARNVI